MTDCMGVEGVWWVVERGRRGGVRRSLVRSVRHSKNRSISANCWQWANSRESSL